MAHISQKFALGIIGNLRFASQYVCMVESLFKFTVGLFNLFLGPECSFFRPFTFGDILCNKKGMVTVPVRCRQGSDSSVEDS
jgi:hypothetical protein